MASNNFQRLEMNKYSSKNPSIFLFKNSWLKIISHQEKEIRTACTLKVYKSQNTTTARETLGKEGRS
jgi:hypothetical protein